LVQLCGFTLKPRNLTKQRKGLQPSPGMSPCLLPPAGTPAASPQILPRPPGWKSLVRIASQGAKQTSYRPYLSLASEFPEVQSHFCPLFQACCPEQQSDNHGWKPNLPKACFSTVCKLRMLFLFLNSFTYFKCKKLFYILRGIFCDMKTI
jgi:hypothetical protein